MRQLFGPRAPVTLGAIMGGVIIGSGMGLFAGLLCAVGLWLVFLALGLFAP